MDHLPATGWGAASIISPATYSRFTKRRCHLPVTEQIYEEILTLPLFPDITDAQVEHVIEAVKSGISNQ